ncbi:MAG: beta-ketoacyl-[acyl-carrier-protein] synthase II [Sulfobacillus thermosulfidooxidans]|uniref:beta-ketoacyl-ACP synthase II n=1 Tax=Sulfobacillus sp. hq2 TaxID=2039167 RepID=UPI000CD26886|nr:beta-ketoacyl-ACP synthase II [Sulfobacillus sp. hq2]MCY0908062.1 beta-ketoacyl-ACP synthase II [Sulfobacillus thermotolerans]POB09176.1 beta-ketoacyl-[acyl-carrier-protein] synthase II [Sulfobacillus sp. hq2]PSR35932.1 MAG: beta-ketoacyl-[acyl-carrier-protein] synthase II [Sulfobacillus thermosulfidooxidans]
MQRERVVVTGMGVVSPVGSTLETLWAGLISGQSGVGPVTRFDASDFPTRIAAEVHDFDPLKYVEKKEARHMDRFVQMAVAAAQDAYDDAELHDVDPERSGVAAGTGIGGMETLTEQHEILLTKGPGRVSPFFIPKMIANIAGAQVAMRFNLQGPNVTLVTACASSGSAIGDALRAIQYGEADVMLAGGSEAVLLPIAFAGFCAMKAMSTRNDDPVHASRPFDKERDGFVMGEGAGFLVLESLSHAKARNARIYAELVGYGRSADAFHVVEPHPEGRGAAQAMRRALRDADIDPNAVDYINAHGTSTQKGDLAETLAIKEVFGEHAYRLAVSSTKSVTGHLLGAAGAVELIASILAIKHQTVPPTVNLMEPSDDCDLNYVPNTPQQRPVHVVMSNAFGFGGQNAAIVAREYVS